ncbi:MAG: TlpA disulfide reductase family protein [Longimicrobiales bacterium]
MNARIVTTVVAVSLGLGIASSKLHVRRNAHPTGGYVGRAMPMVRLPIFDNSTRQSGSAIVSDDSTELEFSGRRVVVNVWATWCGPCIAEYDALRRAEATYPDVLFVGMVYHDEPASVRRFLAQRAPTTGITVFANDRFTKALSISSVPWTFFVERRGRIAGVEKGGPLEYGQIADHIEQMR